MSSSQPFLASSPTSTTAAGRRRKSRFTYKHLAQLALSSTTCPLRVIAHIDLDAFYAQCEGVRLGIPEEQPLAVQQWQGLIAINYPARKFGLNRHITITEARKLCPDLIMQHVATWKEGDEKWAYHKDAFAHIATHKVSLDPYRLESRRILACIKDVLPAPPLQRVEKASVDEVFLDLSAQIHSILLERYPEISGPAPYDDPTEFLPRPPSTVLDWNTDALVDLDSSETEDDDPDWDDVAILLGSEIVRSVRAAVRERLKYTCSAGIARNKMIAKLGSAHKKPNQQTIVRNRAVQQFMGGFKFTKIRNLGGKLGDEVVNKFGTDQVKELLTAPIEQLKSKLGDDTGTWVYHIIRGEDSSEVNARTQIKSMLSAKSFRPTINTTDQAVRWLRIFVADIQSRLVEEGVLENKRRPKVLSLHHRQGAQMRSRQAAIPSGRPVDERLLFDIAKNLLGQIVIDGRAWPCSNLQLSVGGFEDGPTGNRGIGSFLVRGEQAKAMVPNYNNVRDADGYGWSKENDQPDKRRKIEHGAIQHLFHGQDSHEEQESDEADVQHADAGRHSLSASDHDNGPAKDEEEDVLALDETARKRESARASGQQIPRLMTHFLCHRCGNNFPMPVKEEHDDWHFAREVQAKERSISRSSDRPSDPHRSASSSGSNAKDKSSALSKLNHPAIPKKMEKGLGGNRSLEVVEQEAVDFLRVLREEGFFKSEDAFQNRMDEVQGEIKAGSVKGVVQEDHSYANLGGTWTQTHEELEFGVRRAWRNARKCIMRSHCEELKLCDLRGVTSSAEMVTELVRGVSDAFNGGNVQPTVFAFPPRNVNARGPMIWNHQVLQFAGYKIEGGTILGDPMSVEVTNAMIDLGWQPPEPRGRWDLLPLVAMAEGDRPAMIELPADLRKLINIRHPQYTTEFERLNLKWVAFPALTRLGFDIGGVQYTAAPFIGWFMDAEIGVRDLADSFRYNVLPEIIDTLSLTRDKLHGDIEAFEDLPEYEKLSMLSRAQAELNYAVHWSFVQAKVNMTDTLTASMKWCQYDDDFKQRNGYRLPADPYWLAPPQGSIVPLWHRGGAPNYQPKPMICKHVQDPIKAWRREKQKGHAGAQILKSGAVIKEPTVTAAEKVSKTGIMTHQTEMFLRWNSLQLFHGTQKEVHEPENEIETVFTNQQTEDFLRRNSLQLFQRTQREGQSLANGNQSILIFFCSAGTIAEKLANKLHKWLSSLVKDCSYLRLCSRSEPLNSLSASDLTADNILLLVVSSTGKGEIPSNGLGLPELCENILSRRLMDRTQGFRFDIFGNGDSRYSATYNGAAIKINDHLTQVGGYPLAAGLFQADTAMELPVSALKSWLNKLQPSIFEKPVESIATAVVRLPTDDKHTAVFVKVTPVVELGQKYEDYQDRLLSTLGEASLVGASPGMREGEHGSLLVKIDVDSDHFEEMSCIQILPSNAPSKVSQALRSLRVKGSDRVDLGLDGKNPTYLSFLTDYVDLELPFSDVEWLEAVEIASHRDLSRATLSKLSVRNILERLHSRLVQMSDGQKYEFIHHMCQDMPLLHTRTYSIASSQHYSPSCDRVSVSTGRDVDIMVKVLAGGRFSDTFVKDSAIPSSLRYRIVDSPSGAILRKNHLRPFVIVATGAGFGPVRCLLQWRMQEIRDALAMGHPLPSRGSGFSFFLGLKPSDVGLIVDVLNEAMSLNLIDMLDIVLSNPMKRRVYDNLRRFPQHLRNKVFRREGVIFICANTAAAKATKSIFEKILGGRVGEILGERYVEEIF